MQSEKIELTDRQHEEMLLFTEGTLEDIREQKSIQKQGVIGVLSLMGAMLAIAEKKTPLGCPLQTVLSILTFLAGILGVLYVIHHQKSIVSFRERLKRIYNNHFTLRASPIIGIGKESFYDDPNAFSPLGDEVKLWIVIIGAAVLFCCFWYAIST